MLDDDELRERAEAGTLKEIPGIGDVDRRGHRPGRRAVCCRHTWRRCEEKRGGPLADGRRRAVRRAARRPALALRLERRRLAIEEMVLAAVELGHEWLALTDHSPRLTVANGLSAERLTEQLERRRRRSTRASATRSGCSRASRSTSSIDGDLDQTTTCSAGSTSSPRRPLQAADEPSCDDDAADGRGRVATPASTCSATAPGRLVDGRPRQPAAVRLRRRDGLRGLPRARHARSRSTRGPSGCDPPDELIELAPRPRLPLHHRLRRARAGPARHEGAGLRARRAARHPGRAHRHDVAGRRGPGVGKG